MVAMCIYVMKTYIKYLFGLLLSSASRQGSTLVLGHGRRLNGRHDEKLSMTRLNPHSNNLNSGWMNLWM